MINIYFWDINIVFGILTMKLNIKKYKKWNRERYFMININFICWKKI
jgi:hypothetical protein